MESIPTELSVVRSLRAGLVRSVAGDHRIVARARWITDQANLSVVVDAGFAQGAVSEVLQFLPAEEELLLLDGNGGDALELFHQIGDAQVIRAAQNENMSVGA